MNTLARLTTFRERLRRGDRLLGTFVKTPHPVVVEVLGESPLDCLCIDAEHAPFDRGISIWLFWLRERPICRHSSGFRMQSHPPS